MSSQNIGESKFKKANKVMSIRMVSFTLKNLKNEDVPVDTLIFERLSLNIFESGDLKKFLGYELSPFPLSLCSEDVLGKTNVRQNR